MGEISILRPRRSLVSIPVIGSRLLRELRLGLELQWRMLRRVWQHLRLAAS